MKPTTCLFIIAYTFANCLSAQLMSTASGTEGVAPFGVHFNALNPGSGVIQPPTSGGISFSADFQYEWDFGDPLSGNWPSSGRSRNHDIGFSWQFNHMRFDIREFHRSSLGSVIGYNIRFLQSSAPHDRWKKDPSAPGRTMVH